MTKKKKTVLIVSISFLTVIVLGFGCVMISGACGIDSFHGHRFHKRDMPVFMQKEIADFILWRMDKETAALGLSEEQQTRYNDFRSRLQKTMETGMKTRLEFKQQTVLEFEKQTPDISAVALNMASHIESLSSAVSDNLTEFAGFYDTLDTDQKAGIVSLIKERITEHNNGSYHGRETE